MTRERGPDEEADRHHDTELDVNRPAAEVCGGKLASAGATWLRPAENGKEVLRGAPVARARRATCGRSVRLSVNVDDRVVAAAVELGVARV